MQDAELYNVRKLMGVFLEHLVFSISVRIPLETKMYTLFRPTEVEQFIYLHLMCFENVKLLCAMENVVHAFFI